MMGDPQNWATRSGGHAQRHILFFKYGSFSHINHQVKTLLEREFPHHRVVTVDLLDDVRRPLRIVARNGLSVLRHFRGRVLGGEPPWAFYYYTPYVFNKVRETVARVAGELKGNIDFTFQTQSLFDAGIPGIPHFVYTDHVALANLYYPTFDRRKLPPRQWLDLEPTVYDNASRVLVMSHHVERALVEQYHVPRERVRLVGAGFNAPVPSSPGRAEPQTILFVGLEWERKGGPELLEAFRRLQPRFPQAKLVIVGSSPPVDLPNCEVVGRVPLEEVQRYYQRAGIFCLPTRIEPFGVVYLEAMSHGLPIVAPDIGALPDIVEDGVTGLLTPPGDVDALTRTLACLLDDAALAQSFGDAGRQRVLSEFTWEAVGRRIKSAVLDAMALPVS
ncbi:glycosyltransferase family 4 protein [Azospirillum sp. sgz302134]